MIVYKTFFKVLKKYAVVMIMYASIAFALIIILSKVNTGSNNAYSSISQGIVIKDNDNSELSKALTAYLGSVNSIKNGDFTDEQITDMMYFTRISNYLVIPEGFGNAFLSGSDETLCIESTKDSGSRMGYSVETEIGNYLRLLKGYIRGGYSFSEADKLTLESLSNTDDVKLLSDTEEKDDNIFIVFQLLPYGILTMLLSAVLPVILRFSNVLINKRTAISALPAYKKQLMLLLGGATVTFAIFLALMSVASALSGEAFSERWWLLVIDVLVFCITVIMIVVALANFRLKPDSSPAITNIIALSFSFLGGIFVPMEYLGGAAKNIGQFLPTYWYSEAITKIKTGSGFSEIINCLLIQLLFGGMVLVIGLFVGKCNVKKAE